MQTCVRTHMCDFLNFKYSIASLSSLGRTLSVLSNRCLEEKNVSSETEQCTELGKQLLCSRHCVYNFTKSV